MRLVDLVDLTADPAFVIGADQRLVSVNEAAAALVGEPVEGLVGRPCADVIAALHPGGTRVCSSTDCPVYRAMATHQPVSLDWSGWASSNGSVLPITGTAVSVPADEDAAGGVALVIVHVGIPANAAVPLEVKLLGETTLLVGGERVPLPRRRRAIELLMRLTIAGPAGVHRDQLLDEFWPNVASEISAPRLRVLVHALRQLLGSADLAETLIRRGWMYVLDASGLRIDALDFEACARRVLRADLASTPPEILEAALRMYEGDLASHETFGDWAIPEVERLRGVYHDLLQRAAQYFARCHAVDRSIAVCELALRSDPLQEQFQIAMIDYYGYLGRREEAVHQYEGYCRILASEIGVPPPPSTVRALERALQAS